MSFEMCEEKNQIPVRTLAIDQDDVIDEDDDEDAEGPPPGTSNDAIPLDCSMCSIFKSNAEKAWGVTVSYAETMAKLKQAETTITHFRRIIDESRTYTDEQRKTISELTDQLNSKNQEISDLKERLDMSKQQYHAVFERANELRNESKSNFDLATDWRLKYEKSQEVLAKVNERREKNFRQMQAAVNIATKYNKELEELKAGVAKSSLVREISAQTDLSGNEISAQPDLSGNNHEELDLMIDDDDFEQSEASSQDSNANILLVTPITKYNKKLEELKAGVAKSSLVREISAQTDLSGDDLDHHDEELDLMIDDDDFEQSEAANQDSNTNTLLTADTTITPASTSHQRNTSNSTAIDKRNIESIFRSSFLRDVARLPLVAPLLTTNKIIKTPDEIIRELGIKQGHLMVGKGKLAIHDIQRSTGATKKEAALLAVKAYQANAELRRGEDKQPAVANNNKFDPNEMAWTPKRNVLPRNCTTKSVLTWSDHQRYVSIVQNLLKAEPTFRFENNRIEYKAMDDQLVAERKQFEEMALIEASYFKPSQPFNLIHSPRDSLNNFKSFYNVHSKRELSALKSKSDRLELSKTIAWPKGYDQGPLEKGLEVEQVLNPGSSQLITIPNVRQKCVFNYKPGPMRNYLCREKIPIDSDQTLFNFALESNLEFALDCVTLRHFLTGPYTCRSASYATQVNIVGRIHQGEIRRICVVNKPVLVSQISPPEISRHIVKWAVKKRLLHGSEPSGSKNAADNFLNALPTIEEKKRYSIVNIDASGGDKYRVLVRSTPHGEIWQGDKLGNKSISFTVKPEFLPEFGAEALHFEEHISGYLAAKLKGSAEHLYFRVEPHKLHLQQLEYRSTKSFLGRLPMECRNVLSARFQRFCSLLDTLKTLEFGTFLILTDNDKETLNIYKPTDEGGGRIDESSANESISLRNLLSRVSFDQNRLPMKPIEACWNGLDPHTPLQWHIVHRRIPGSFPPRK